MPDAAGVYLVLSVINALFTCCAVFRFQNLRYFTPMFFFISWLSIELALYPLMGQLVASLYFIGHGVLESNQGRLAFALSLFCITGYGFVLRQAHAAKNVYDTVLNPLDPSTPPATPIRPGDWLLPFAMKRPGVKCIRNITYGDAGHRNHLDLYLPDPLPQAPCPVLLQIHGGAWMIGNKAHQGLPLMYHMAARGWICVAPNYQLSPKVRFPEHLIDAKRVVAWVQQHGANYGADPTFIAITGGSAGAHLASLVALTPNQPELQPGFEEVDTSVNTCIPIYGLYDFLNRKQVLSDRRITQFLARFVMQCQPEDDPDLWDLASPITLAHRDAPPFFAIHGTHDSLLFVEDARHFIEELRSNKNNRVIYAELPGAQHGFDVFHSLRTAYTVRAISRFLSITYAAAQKDVSK